MKIRILGAHNVESAQTGFASLLIDDVLAVDAGALTSSLSYAQQEKLKAVFLTHPHYDHIRDIPAIGMNMSYLKKSLDIYAAAPVREALLTHLINDKLYPDFTKRPPEKPSLRLIPLEPGEKVTVDGYEVFAITVTHSAPATGFQVTSPDGKKVFITSDTGPDLAEVWKQISPDMLITEVTALNKDDKFAHKAGHLTPTLLQKELESFFNLKNYLPKVVLTHYPYLFEKELKAEVRAVEKALKIKLIFSHEGMTVKI